MNTFTIAQLRGKTSRELRDLVRNRRHSDAAFASAVTGVEAANLTIQEAELLLTGAAADLLEARRQLITVPVTTGAAAPMPAPTPAPTAPVMATTAPADITSAAAAFAEALATQQSQGLDTNAVKQIAEKVAQQVVEDATITADPEDLKNAITEVLQDLGKSHAPTLRRAVRAATASAGTNQISNALMRFCNPDNPSRPLLLAGPAGTSKTTNCRQHGKEFENCFEHQAAKEQRLTQLLGKDIPVPVNGALGFAWTDAPISQAFRAAANGESTLLIIDEMLRLTGDTRKALLSALAPTLDGFYKLNTGRVLSVVDGVATTETLTAPVDKLAIVATSNVGTQYALEESCPAEAERFKYEYIATDWKDVEEKLEHAAREYGWTQPAATAYNLITVGQGTESLQASCELWHSASLRTLARALRDATPNDKQSLIGYIMDEAQTWTAKDADGRPMPAQLAQVQKLADTTLLK